jgi:3-hydroxyacyl-[acyl-carrier-protein] dehydratase
MNSTTPEASSASAANGLTGAEVAELQEALKRCPPATFEAACNFRKTGDPSHLRAILFGVIERYVEREVRPKVRTGDESLRLIEDLGIDSLTMMEIVLLAEDVLRISVTNEELTKLRTIGDVRQFVAAKVTSA